VALFVVVVALISVLLTIEKDQKIEDYLQTQTKAHNLIYRTVLKQFTQTADIIHDSIENNIQVIDIYKNTTDQNLDEQRQKLYEVMKGKYQDIAGFKIDQFNFYLPDNRSFLKVYNKDNHLDIDSKMIPYVNKFETSVMGFEMDNHDVGFHFIYPIEDDENYYGSMEIVYSTHTFIKNIMENFQVLSNFHILKTKENTKFFELHKEDYKPSPVKNHYVYAKTIDAIKKKNKQMKLQIMERKNNDYEKVYEKILQDKKPFSIRSISKSGVITHIPIFSPLDGKHLGMVSIKGYGKYIDNKTNNYYYLLMGSILFSLVVFLFIYKDFKKTQNINELLNKRVKEKTKELSKINETLEARIQIEVDKTREKDAVMMEQSKMVAMGEMIGNIAHQWRQPLSAISSLASSMNVQNQMGLLQHADVDKNTAKIMEHSRYLSDIINIFRNFLKDDKVAKDAILQDEIETVLNIVGITLKDNNIKLAHNLGELESIHIHMVVGELSQVIINIINNAKDILLEKEVIAPSISLQLIRIDNKVTITIEDNGGGIPDHVMPKIFEPYFTTKHQSQGTGLGLHMSYKIMTESLGGNLYVQNTDIGAKFFVEVPLDK
jgi:signal transduction histidine kinase